MSSKYFRLLYSFERFSHQRLLMVFHLGASDTKYPQVSKSLLSIKADVNNAIVWMVSIRPLSRSRSFFSFFSIFPCDQPERQIPLFDRFSLFFIYLTLTRSGCLAEMIHLYLKILCVSFSRIDLGLYTYNLLIRSNLQFLHSS